MDLIDKLKSITDYVTGGGAEFKISLPEKIDIGKPFNVHVRCTAQKDIKPKRVYITLLSVETIEIREFAFKDARSQKERVHKESVLYKSEHDISGSRSLREGQTYEWKAEVTIPENANGTYDGKHAWHEWRLQVALDVPGNDPDSGWIIFRAS